MKELMKNITLGKNMVILPDEITEEVVENLSKQLVSEIINIDTSKNAANKLYVVSEVLKTISSAAKLSTPISVYLSDYGTCEIYKKAPSITHTINCIVVKNIVDKANLLALQWSNLLVANHQDICKETNSMILDVREGRNFYFIVKK